MLGLLLAAAAVADPCTSTKVPSIPVHVVAPDPSVDPRLRALSGVWGGAWGGQRESRLVVERVDDASATVVYEIAPHGNGVGVFRGGAERLEAAVAPDGTLAVPAWGLTFRPRPDGRLDGTVPGATVFMERCPAGPPRGEPPVRDDPTPALIVHLLAWYGFPLLLWVALRRVLRGEWRWIGLGARTWLVALPAIVVVPMLSTAALAGQDAALVWGIALSLTAGVAEEGSRWWFYRRAGAMGRREAILAGAGHGGTEALVLGLQFAVAPLVMVLSSPDPAAYAALEVAAVTGTVTRPLLVLGHVGLSIVVWHGVAGAGRSRLALAIALHVAIDLLAFALPVVAPWTTGAVLLPVVGLAAYAVLHVAAEARAVRRPA